MHFFTHRFLLLLVFGITALWLSAQDPAFQEDFANGIPDDWTVVTRLADNPNVSVWSYTTAGPQGQFAVAPLASTTNNNGWIIFDSDLYCDIGTGQDAWIISPPIDVTDFESFFFQFETFYRKFFDMPMVRIGSDLNDLDSWDAIEVFPDLDDNQFSGGSAEINPFRITLDLTENIEEETTVYFAFQFLSDESTGPQSQIGCAYSWQIDDVAVFSGDPRPATDLRITDFFAIPRNAATPRSQVSPIFFLADVENAGSMTQNTAQLRQVIFNAASETVFEDSTTVPAIESDSTAFDLILSPFTPEPVADNYIGNYVVQTVDEDGNPEDNIRTFPFAVTDNQFTKATVYDLNGISPQDDNAYTYGNVFYVPNGEGYFAKEIGFEITNADELAGVAVTTFLYEWEGDANGDFAANPDEYGGAPIAFNVYTFDGTENEQLIRLPVDVDNDSVALTDDRYYIAAIAFFPDNDIDQMSMLASQLFNYEPAFLSTLTDERPVYASAISVGEEANPEFNLFGFGFDIVPRVELFLSDPLPTSTRNQQLPESALQVTPNPADDHILVNIQLDIAPQQGRLLLFDHLGRIIREVDVEGVDSQQLNLNTAALANGHYLLHLRTENGGRSLPVVVQHP